MGSNNGYGNNRFFQNNFNQDGFSQSPFMEGHLTPQYFQPQPQTQSNRAGFEGDGNGEGYLNNDFQPSIGHFNETAFSHNQFSSPVPQFSPPPFSLPQYTPPTPSHPPQQLNSTAAELKAKLLKSRASSATPNPSIQNMAAQKPVPSSTGITDVFREGKQNIPAKSQGYEQQLDDLITECSSDAKPVTKVASTIKQEEKSIISYPHSSQQPKAIPAPTAKSQTLSSGSPAKVSKPVSNGKLGSNGTTSKPQESKQASDGALSEASEGEIIEESKPPQSSSSKEPSQIQAAAKPINEAQQSSRRPPPVGSTTKQNDRRGSRNESPPPRTSTVARPPFSRGRDDRREEIEPGSERRYQSDYGRRKNSDSDKHPLPRRDTREQIEDGRTDTREQNGDRKLDAKTPQKREAREPVRETKPPIPTLAQLLPHDEKLREWLEITGYHNETYRDKILNRRRQLALLEEKKKAILAEMEAEEGRGIPMVGLASTLTTGMPPPPIPVKNPIQPAKEEVQRDRVVSNKRSYGQFQDGRDNEVFGKISRTDDRGFKKEQDDDDRRPRSSGLDSFPRASSDRRIDRDTSHSYGNEHRGRGRGGNRERDMSPVFQPYENRRNRGYESPDDYFNQDEDRDPRPYEVRGGYRGRGYDPNYRGRGRGGGRGRGDYQNRDDRAYSEPRDSGPPVVFGSRIANGKPYKDHKGFSKGGKGETRYFIVKSFNEDNVLKCIEDSVWTTQAQNGPIFKEAFETCKNVILVFSINKSRAFQGYARMESLPGSVETPHWQKQITWESAGAFKVRWLVVCHTRFQRIGHLKNAFNDNQAVLIGKDGQEIEENCAAGLVELIDEEANMALRDWRSSP